MIELNEVRAKQLDEILIFAESLGFNKPFDMYYYQRTGRKDLDINYLFHLLSLGKFYMEKYRRQWFYAGQRGIPFNMNTRSFLDSGGFIEVLRNEIQEQRLKDLNEKQLKKNIWQLKYWWLLIIINAIIAFLFTKFF